MKIEYIDYSQTQFGRIEFGECFMADEELYMRISTIYIASPSEYIVSPSDESCRRNAVRLEDGRLYAFDDASLVKPVEAKVVIE